ncbi:hypothetical protein [Streptomyces sp. PanSC9]|uniref:hypothetical protein n=1 Tax=Streptomyces sp. PanSC9 TaxID=1520461 RepID=UPI0011CE20FC|nr:hypothetical protein [Streptomyces sp. PanSC9]
MSEMRRGWTAAAGVLAAVLMLGGCGGSTSDEEGKAKPPPPTPTVEDSPAWDTALPTAEEPAAEYAPGPEGAIDQKADEESWMWDSDYSSASEYVQDMCDSLPSQSKDTSPAQWLAEAGYMDEDGQKILKYGVPKLCPKWTQTIKAAVSGDYPRYISGGEYEVKTNPAPYDPDSGSDVQEIGPGTYVATGHFSDCYWERTDANGNIIDNQFVTQATRLTVTLQVGELFKNECGTFKPAS